MNNPDRELESLRERIADAHEISGADQRVLEEFDRALGLERQDVGLYRHVKLLRHNVIMAEECGGLADALEEREAAERLVAWIHDSYSNEETNQDYRVALKGLGRRVTDNGGEPPESLEWISSNTSGNHDPAPRPGDMLKWDVDIQPMLEACQNPRDKAAIALQWDAGLRGGEFAGLTLGDVTDHEHGLQVTVDGKQGRRTVTLIPSVPYVQRWLAEHPGGREADAPLWCSLSDGSDISYAMKARMLADPAGRAGVSKPVTPTNFRKSTASHLASQGMNQAHIEDHHGWVRGSKVASRYVSVFSSDADRELARVHGMDVEAEEPDPTAPLTCPRCGKDTPRERELCVWCGQALEPGAAEKADAVDDMLFRALADATGDDAETIIELRERWKADAEFRAEAIDELMAVLGRH